MRGARGVASFSSGDDDVTVVVASVTTLSPLFVVAVPRKSSLLLMHRIRARNSSFSPTALRPFAVSGGGTDMVFHPIAERVNRHLFDVSKCTDTCPGDFGCSGSDVATAADVMMRQQ